MGRNLYKEHSSPSSMSNHEIDYYLNEFHKKPKERRWWSKSIAIFAVAGAIYGAAIGAAINTPGAANVIAATAIILALVCGVPGARYGFFFGLLNRIRFARLFVGTVATIAGAILGGLLGILAAMPFGAIVGAFCGWFFTREILQRGFFARLLGIFVGLVLGSCVEAAVLAFQRDQVAALVGIAWGIGIGGVIGPLLLVLFIKTLTSIPLRRP